MAGETTAPEETAHGSAARGPGRGLLDGRRATTHWADCDALAERSPRVMAAYGANDGRLAAIETKHDPENFFRANQNVAPVAA